MFLSISSWPRLPTGTKNVFIGSGSGYNISSGENNICIGNISGPGLLILIY